MSTKNREANNPTSRFKHVLASPSWRRSPKWEARAHKEDMRARQKQFYEQVQEQVQEQVHSIAIINIGYSDEYP